MKQYKLIKFRGISKNVFRVAYINMKTGVIYQGTYYISKRELIQELRNSGIICPNNIIY
jgi:hypothetical protein